MPFADLADVQARLGRFAGLLAAAGSAQHPNEDDATELLDDVSAEIASAIRSRGFDPDTLTVEAQTALKDLAAFGAIARLLAGVQSDKDLDKLRDYARSVWAVAMGDSTAKSFTREAVLGSIRIGAHPVIAALEAGEGGGGTGAGAGNFWDDEPDYGSPAQVAADRELLEPGHAPFFAKGMSA